MWSRTVRYLTDRVWTLRFARPLKNIKLAQSANFYSSVSRPTWGWSLERSARKTGGNSLCLQNSIFQASLRSMSSSAQGGVISSSGPGIKALAAAAIGTALALLMVHETLPLAGEIISNNTHTKLKFASEGLASPTTSSSQTPEVSKEATTAFISSSNDSPPLTAGVVENDFEPTYSQLSIKEVNNHIVLEWDQNGVPFRHVLDQNGNTVAGPGPVNNEDATNAGGEEHLPICVVDDHVSEFETQTDNDPAVHPESTSTPSADELIQNIISSLGRIDSAVASQRALKSTLDGYPVFHNKSTSLLKKHLTPDVYLACAARITPNGFTFDRAIQSGIDNQDSGIGCYAGDEDSYTVFAPLFDKIIEDYHNGYNASDKHVSDLDSSKISGMPDEEGKYVLSTRIRVGRNIRGLGLSPGITRAQRRMVESIVVDALANVEGDLAGKYFALAAMSEEDRAQLVKDHFLFKKGDRFLESAGANRDWPESRGIFHNNEKTFLVWVNEEDQMRIISMQKGSDAKQVFHRLVCGIAAIEERVKAAGYEFAYNDHLGFIHSCPTNCGTGMRASVHVKLPHVGQHPNFKQWCELLRLQSRGIHGEHSESEGGIFDISNKERLGRSEVELVQTMIDGVKTLIAAEKALESGVPLPEELQS